MDVGQVACIVLRGHPLMHAYEPTDGADEAVPRLDGWFETGDLGYLDHDGWLFVTGRSKDVINRGGETIAPVEIEEVCCHATSTACTIMLTARTSLLTTALGSSRMTRFIPRTIAGSLKSPFR